MAKAQKSPAGPKPPHQLTAMTTQEVQLRAVRHRVVVECDNNLQALFAGLNQVLNETWSGQVSHATAVVTGFKELAGGRVRFTVSYLTVPQ